MLNIYIYTYIYICIDMSFKHDRSWQQWSNALCIVAELPGWQTRLLCDFLCHFQKRKAWSIQKGIECVRSFNCILPSRPCSFGPCTQAFHFGIQENPTQELSIVVSWGVPYTDFRLSSSCPLSFYCHLAATFCSCFSGLPNLSSSFYFSLF